MAKNKEKKKGEACPVMKTSIGGQALMEGIMMRGPKVTAMAVRNPQGEIVIEEFPTTGKKRPVICRWPIIRGVFGFIDSMTLGYKCLMRSAEISGLEELEEEMAREKAEKKAAKRAAKATKNGEPVPAVATETISGENTEAVFDTPIFQETAVEPLTPPIDKGKKKDKESSALMGGIMVASMVIAIVLMVGLFVILPTWLYDSVLARYIPWVDAENRFAQSVFEGVMRVLLMIGYMSLICLMKDIRRTFQYHGAEHKTIFCYENGLELTVENVRKQKRFHPRCGTSFLILMMLVSIIVGFAIPATLPLWLRSTIKILLVPLIMGLGYELIKICGRHDNWLTRIISAPGVWFQHITVHEPDDSMIECAIASIKRVIPEDGSDKY